MISPNLRIVKNCGSIMAVMTENIRGKYTIETMGCQMNERDSETMAGLLEEMGYRCADSGGYSEKAGRQDADLLLVNTCSVRENADKRFFGVLGQLKNIKERKPDTIIAVCGCMMQQQHIVDRIKEKYSWVDIVFGTHNIHELPDLLTNVRNEKKKVVDVWEDAGDIVEGLPSERKYRHKAFVNIMYGCDNFCTYCIVPYTRGRERSRRPEEILSEIETLVADGVREVMLLGQNVNSYKGINTTGEAVDFADLLEMIDCIEGLERLRFMTSHPKDLPDKLINKFQTLNTLTPSIHLPVQSGSTDVLRRMNRKYTKQEYLNLLERLRDASPNIVITTDFIVGFPGESEKDFEETMDLIEKAYFDSAFTFIYSVRKGTPAENFEDQVPEDIKHTRFNRMVRRLNEITFNKNEKYIGRIEEVLVEGESKKNSGDALMLSGRTSGGKLVNFEGSPDLIGQIISVRITDVNTFSFTGVRC